MALAAALSLATASRESIYEASFSVGTGNNKAIRRALGFREIGRPEAKFPRFVCPKVQMLYNRINDIAVERLPNTTLDQLRHAWQSGTFTREMEEVSIEFGDIWTDSLAERHSAAIPGPRLYVAGEVEYCRDDLFWEVGRHRKFIALQLEHLAFVKAAAYYANHYRNTPQKVQTETRKPSKASTQQPRSLVAILRLPQETLFNVWDMYSKNPKNNRKRKRKRKIPRHHVDNDRNYWGRRPVINVSDASGDENTPSPTRTQERREGGALERLPKTSQAKGKRRVIDMSDGSEDESSPTHTREHERGEGLAVVPPMISKAMGKRPVSTPLESLSTFGVSKDAGRKRVEKTGQTCDQWTNARSSHKRLSHRRWRAIKNDVEIAYGATQEDAREAARAVPASIYTRYVNGTAEPNGPTYFVDDWADTREGSTDLVPTSNQSPASRSFQPVNKVVNDADARNAQRTPPESVTPSDYQTRYEQEGIEQRLEGGTDLEGIEQRLEGGTDLEDIEQRLEGDTDLEDIEQRLEGDTDLEGIEQRLEGGTDLEGIEQRLEGGTDLEGPTTTATQADEVLQHATAAITNELMKNRPGQTSATNIEKTPPRPVARSGSMDSIPDDTVATNARQTPSVLVTKARRVSKLQRDKLRMLLNGELCQHEHSHSKLGDAAAMWDKSRELYESIALTWENERDRIRSNLDAEEFRHIEAVLMPWLVLCRGVRMLGELTRWHPLENKPAPPKTYEEWVELLGGDSEYDQKDFELTCLRQQLAESQIYELYEADREGVADTLTKAFAAATQYPNGAKAFKKGTVKLNEKLFSMVLDFQN